MPFGPTAPPQCVSPDFGPFPLHDFPRYEIISDGLIWDTECKECVPLWPDYRGYAVTLTREGELHYVFIDRLLAMYYIPNPDNKPCVGHRDGNNRNNELTNLQWVENRQPTAPQCVTPAIGPVRIHDYPNFQIWPDGRVWNTKRKKFVTVSYHNGYPRVSLSRGSRDTYEQWPAFVHRLLAMYFIPNPESKPCIDHRDRDRCNNTLTNLRWVTHIENQQNQSLSKANKSGTQGVRFDVSQKTPWWIACIRVNKKTVKRRFVTQEGAIAWRQAMELKHYIQD